jgi:hypothetical protein
MQSPSYHAVVALNASDGPQWHTYLPSGWNPPIAGAACLRDGWGADENWITNRKGIATTVWIARIGYGSKPGGSGYDPSRSRLVLFPVDTRLSTPSARQVGRVALAVLCTPFTVAVDVVILPIEGVAILINPDLMHPFSP